MSVEDTIRVVDYRWERTPGPPEGVALVLTCDRGHAHRLAGPSIDRLAVNIVAAHVAAANLGRGLYPPDRTDSESGLPIV